MSVFTPVSNQELQTFLQRYDVGALVDYEGIVEGIENTNFFVNTTQGQFVLTLFEYLPMAELPWFMELMFGLSAAGVPGAAPIRANDGEFLSVLNGKPAALINRLKGRSQMSPNEAHVAEIGRALGKMHAVGQAIDIAVRENNRGLAWANQIAAEVLPKLSADEAAVLNEELTFQRANPRNNLPQGIVHADLFRDNALFDGEKLTGVIDFYFACHDALLYDLAVLVNDWCIDNQGHVVEELQTALLEGYRSERSISDEEWAAWPQMLRAGALRFWLSRLKDKLFPKEGEMTYIKDPNAFLRILERHKLSA